MRTYEELKDLGTEELQRIEGIFGNRSSYLKLKKEEKTLAIYYNITKGGATNAIRRS